MQVVPSIRSFLIADQVFQQSSGKWCVIGIFGTVGAPRFPAVHYSLGLYVELSDAEGEYDVRVEFQDAQGRCLSQFGGIRLTAKTRLASGALGIQTYNLALPSPGTYFFKLFFNDQLAVGDIKIEAALVERKS